MKIIVEGTKEQTDRIALGFAHFNTVIDFGVNDTTRTLTIYLSDEKADEWLNSLDNDDNDDVLKLSINVLRDY